MDVRCCCCCGDDEEEEEEVEVDEEGVKPVEEGEEEAIVGYCEE